MNNGMVKSRMLGCSGLENEREEETDDNLAGLLF